jgi:hypothetical protein
VKQYDDRSHERGHAASLQQSVSEFLFTPVSPLVLSLIRFFTGAMIAYIHFVWMLRLSSFVGPDALIDNGVWQTIHTNNFKWTYLAHVDNMSVLWCHEIVAMAVGLSLCIGFATRAMAPLAWFLTLMMVHRMTGFLFGLDQIVMMLSMYLMVGRSGDVLSVDRWIGARFADRLSGNVLAKWFGWSAEPVACWTNNVAIRLIQLHLCVIYFFGGLGKLRGDTWWDGTAIWYSVASYEYQSLDMTAIGYFPMLASIMTHVTLFWEVTYCGLVWPRWTRPAVLVIAVFVHAGIAMFLGMVTFGFMMIVANLAFVPPETMQRIFRTGLRWNFSD